MDPTALFLLCAFGSIKLIKLVRNSLTANYAVTLTEDATRFEREE